MKKMRTSLFERAPKLLSTVIKLGQLKDVDGVVENLSELKGIPQKIGQLISMDVTEYLPEDVRSKFSKLQGQSSEFESEKILEIIKSELGEQKFSSIVDFVPQPLGAGSIGQVHRAQLRNGSNVVFKVRYPHIEQTIHSDLSLMLPMAKAYELIRPRSKDFTILLKEAKEMLTQEMNYQIESEHLKYFKSTLQGDDRFYVPEVIDDYSSKNIICMEYVEGVNFHHFLKDENDTLRKAKVAKGLLELFVDEFFTYGIVQTDPNFGNYLIKSNDQITLLDFGATKQFSKDFAKLYFQLLKSAFGKDRPNIVFYGEQLGLVDRRDLPDAVDLFVKFMIDVMSYFRPENNPVDFSNETMTRQLMTNGWELWKKQRISSPNANLVFLHRKLGGLFSILKESKIKLDLYPLWLKIETMNRE